MPQVRSTEKGVWRPAGVGRPGLKQGILKLHNTLTKQKEEFMTLDESGKLVTWYTCGPTVYDAAHLGHARYYVTMDILRRVMEDFFGFNILFVMNVTDVDDKIIRRARHNHLVQKYLAETHDTEKVLQDAETALSRMSAKQEQAFTKAKEQLEDLVGQSAHRQREKDLAERKGIEETKLKRIRENVVALQQLKAQGLSNGNAQGANGYATESDGKRRQKIVDAAGDALAEMLDEEHGDKVTDHKVFREHAARYEAEFLEDMDMLKCRPPHVLTRVSEYMQEIREYVDKIHANGMAYAVDGSVYFDTEAFREMGHTYGKLAPQAINSAAAADGEANFASSDKKNKSDFALWKQAKPGEPAWDSPECARDEHGNLSKGRPGWHIECSAMASSIIGPQIDIHTGGADLAFPHHENELAQAEAFYHAPTCSCEPQWVNYFLHAGHLNIDNMKMSKSLKNFITIREALKKFSPRVLRIMFALTPWDKPMTYSDAVATTARQREGTLVSFFSEVEAVLHKFGPRGSQGRLPTRWEAEEKALEAELLEAEAKVDAALLDSIDVCSAMTALFKLISSTNTYMKNGEAQYAADPKGLPPQWLLLRQVAAYITRILRAFGIAGEDEIGLGRDAVAAAGASSEGDKALLDIIASFREDVRAAGKGSRPGPDVLALCDRLRDEVLPEHGIHLEDRAAGGSICRYMTPAEQEQRQAAKEELVLLAVKVERDKAEKEVEKLKKEVSSLDKLDELWAKYTRLEGGLAEKGAAAPEKDVKELKSEAKNVWKYLKPFKVTPSDGGLGPQERELIQGIVSGNIPLNAKPAADITAKWNTLESMGDASAAERSKVESDVMALLYRSLPDAANARLGSLVPPVLGRRADILAAIAEKEAQLGHLPSTPTTPKIVKP